jgi:MFS family permease
VTIFSTFNPTVKRQLTILFGAGLCFWAGLAGLLPTLPLFIATLGGGGQQIGLVMASFALGLLLFRPSLSDLADSHGRKLVMLIGLGAVAIAPFGYLAVMLLTQPISSVLNLQVAILAMVAIRAFHGLSIAAFVVAYHALVVDVAPPTNRGELIGYMTLVNPLGMALGPALGGYLYTTWGFSTAFAAMGVLGCIGLGLALGMEEADHPGATPSATSPPQPQGFWRHLWTGRIRTPALILLMVGLAFGTLSTFVPLYVAETGVNLNVGLIYTTSAVSSFIARLLVGRASDQHGRGRFITASLSIYSLAMALFWLADSASWFLLAGMVQGIGAGTLIPMVAALMSDRSDVSDRGRTFGLAMIGFDIGIALAGPVLGTVADSFSYRDIFGLCALLILVALGIFITSSSKDLPHSLRFALTGGRDVYAIRPLDG